MKLQIINRLSLNSRDNPDTIPTVRRQSDVLQYKSYDQFTSNHFEHNYYSIDAHCASNYEASCFLQGENSKYNVDHRQFFNNFDVLCTVKYEQTKKVESKYRRKLQNQVRALMMSSKHRSPRNKELLPKFLLIQDNNCIKQKPKKLNSNLQHRNYYLGQNKAKDKIRKINSLASIRSEKSTDVSRKPGFIMKKNGSFMKRQSSEHISLIEDHRPNKENINPNMVTQPDAHRHAGSNVDRQIWQSKQRIARIRQELNDIYEMRREPARFKLKLL